MHQRQKEGFLYGSIATLNKLARKLTESKKHLLRTSSSTGARDRRVYRRRLLKEVLQSSFIKIVPFHEIDRTPYPRQAGVEEPVLILEQASFWERKLDLVFVCLPVQMIPVCDHVGTPRGLVGLRHFTSSTTSGTASLIS